MLSRLFLVLLIVTGPMPVRVCTCTASAAHTVQLPDHDAEESHCCCPSKSKAVDAEKPCEAEHAPLSHDPDCPAANSLPSPQPAVPTPSPDTLTALDLVPLQWNAPYSSTMIPAKCPPLFRLHVDALPRPLEFFALLI